jgi:hypothetical protein
MWGVNVHDAGGPFSSIPVDQQMATIAATGLKNVRLDLYTTGDISILQTYDTAAEAHGLKMLPILIPAPTTEPNATEAYNDGFALAQAFASKFPDIVDWELGNEFDGEIDQTGDGSNISQYNSSQFALVEASIKGMLDGIHSANPNSKGMVSTSGTCHYGFTDGLWADGIRWDITGEHWYSASGDITNMVGWCDSGPINKAEILHSHYGRPIWITEFNENGDPANKAGMAEWLTDIMTQWNSIAKTYDIESAQIYELYDDPTAPGDIESGFGIYNSTGGDTAASLAVKQFLAAHPSAVYP